MVIGSETFIELTMAKYILCATIGRLYFCKLILENAAKPLSTHMLRVEFEILGKQVSVCMYISCFVVSILIFKIEKFCIYSNLKVELLFSPHC